MQITSGAFDNNQLIPSKFSCKGDNISPPFTISKVPSSAQSLVLIMHDPDSPSGNFIHWVAWNIDPTISQIIEGAAPVGSNEGVNDFGAQGYGGPCPHKGTHRYIFSLYALDTTLALPNASSAVDVLAAQNEHVLATASLTGLFSAA